MEFSYQPSWKEIKKQIGFSLPMTHLHSLSLFPKSGYFLAIFMSDRPVPLLFTCYGPRAVLRPPRYSLPTPTREHFPPFLVNYHWAQLAVKLKIYILYCFPGLCIQISNFLPISSEFPVSTLQSYISDKAIFIGISFFLFSMPVSFKAWILLGIQTVADALLTLTLILCLQEAAQSSCQLCSVFIPCQVLKQVSCTRK